MNYTKNIALDGVPLVLSANIRAEGRFDAVVMSVTASNAQFGYAFSKQYLVRDFSQNESVVGDYVASLTANITQFKAAMAILDGQNFTPVVEAP